MKQTSRMKSPQLSRNENVKKPNEQHPIVEELAVETATNQKSASLTSEQGTTYFS